MKNLIETLELYYQPLTQKEKHWDFFLALSDYVRFIISEPDLLDILFEEYKKDLAEQEKIASYEKQSLREQEIKKKKLIALTIKSGANSEKVLNLARYRGCKTKTAAPNSCAAGRDHLQQKHSKFWHRCFVACILAK